MLRWAHICSRRTAGGDAGTLSARMRRALPSQRCRTVLLVIATAGMLCAAVQAGTVVEEEGEPGSIWWSTGATDTGIGSAPLPVPLAGCGDWTPHRGSLYGAIRPVPPERIELPPTDWGELEGGFPGVGGGIGVLSGSGTSSAAGSLTVTSSEMQNAGSFWLLSSSWDILLALDGGVIPTGSVVFLGGVDMAGGSLTGGSLTVLGGGTLELSSSPYSLSSGSLDFTNTVIFAPNGMTSLGPDGTLSPAVNTLSTVPEPGTLATVGLGALLAGWLVRARRRASSVLA